MFIYRWCRTWEATTSTNVNIPQCFSPCRMFTCSSTGGAVPERLLPLQTWISPSVLSPCRMFTCSSIGRNVWLRGWVREGEKWLNLMLRMRLSKASLYLHSEKRFEHKTCQKLCPWTISDDRFNSEKLMAKFDFFLAGNVLGEKQVHVLVLASITYQSISC